MPSHPEKKKRRRRMKKFTITELSAVDRPAQEGALVTIMKRDDSGDDGDLEKVLMAPRSSEKRGDFVSRFMGNDAMKREFPERDQRLAVANRQFLTKKNYGGLDKSFDRIPVLTSAEDGHTHIVWVTGRRGGETTFGMSPGEDGRNHDHPWVIEVDGSLTIGENDGHTHTIAPDSVLAAMRALFMAEEDATEAAADVVFAQHADGPPVDLDDFEDDDLAGLVVKAWLDELFPIRCQSDLRNAISAWDHAEDQARVAGYILKQARALEMEGELPDDGDFADAIAKAAGPVGGGEQEGSEMTTQAKAPVKKSEDGNSDELEKLRAELEVAKAFGQLTDAQRVHHGKLGADEAAAFLKMSPEGREAELTNAAADVKQVFKSMDGTVYTTADDPRLVSLAKDRDAQGKELALSKAERVNDAYAKRAASELENLPGDDPAKVALLKAIDTIDDEAVREGAAAIIKAGNGRLAVAFHKAGTRAGGDAPGQDADGKLNVMAKAHMDANPGVNFFAAYEVVGTANPELLAEAVNG